MMVDYRVQVSHMAGAILNMLEKLTLSQAAARESESYFRTLAERIPHLNYYISLRPDFSFPISVRP